MLELWTSSRLRRFRAALLRRGALARAVLASLLVQFPAVGCTERADEDILVVSQSGRADKLDPHLSTTLADNRILANVFEGLVRFDDEGLNSFVPLLATSLDTVPNSLIRRFEIRRDVTFHDGVRLEAEAVRRNFQRILDLAPSTCTITSMLANVVDTVRAEGDTVFIHLKEPYAPLLSTLGYPVTWLASPAMFDGAGDSIWGTGPFRVSYSSERGDTVELSRNTRYWGESDGVDRIRFVEIEDARSRVEALRRGEVDLTFDVHPDEVSDLQADRRFIVRPQRGPHVWYLILNTRRGPFRDPRYRRAANLAVDKEGLLEYLRLEGEPLSGPLAPYFHGRFGISRIQPYPYDTAHARRLMREAGGEPTEEILFFYPRSGSGMVLPQEISTWIKADLEAVGFTIREKALEWPEYLRVVNQGLDSIDMAAMAWMVDDPHTQLALTVHGDAWPENHGCNSGRYANGTVDSLIEQGRRVEGPAQRGRIYREVQELVRNDAPWLFVASLAEAVAWRSDLRGMDLQPSFFVRLDGIEKKDVN